MIQDQGWEILSKHGGRRKRCLLFAETLHKVYILSPLVTFLDKWHVAGLLGAMMSIPLINLSGICLPRWWCHRFWILCLNLGWFPEKQWSKGERLRLAVCDQHTRGIDHRIVGNDCATSVFHCKLQQTLKNRMCSKCQVFRFYSNSFLLCWITVIWGFEHPLIAFPSTLFPVSHYNYILGFTNDLGVDDSFSDDLTALSCAAKPKHWME